MADATTTTEQKKAPQAPRDSRPRFERGPRPKNPRRGGREERTRPEYDQKLLNIRRVARVVAGGRRFQFSVALVIGNRNGSVGVGTGKAGDTSLAMDKAVRNAKKHMIRIPLSKEFSIPHEVQVKYSSAIVLLMPAPGKGVIAGSAVRDVLALGGVKDVVGKVLSGSKNKLNIARATIEALQTLKKPK